MSVAAVVVVDNGETIAAWLDARHYIELGARRSRLVGLVQKYPLASSNVPLEASRLWLFAVHGKVVVVEIIRIVYVHT